MERTGKASRLVIIVKCDTIRQQVEKSALFYGDFLGFDVWTGKRYDKVGECGENK